MPVVPARASSVIAKVASASWIDTSIDGALSGGHHRVHAGAGGRDAADKGGLFADRADRRLVEIIDLAGQHARDAAREKQRQIGRRIVGLRPGLAIGRNQHERRVRVQRAQRLGIAVPRRAAPAARPRRRSDRPRRSASRPTGCLPLFRCAASGVEQSASIADHVGPDIGEQPAADGGGQPGAELHNAKPESSAIAGQTASAGAGAARGGFIPPCTSATISNERLRFSWSKMLAVIISSLAPVTRTNSSRPSRTVSGPPTTAAPSASATIARA